MNYVIDFIAVFIFMSALAYIAFLFFIWLRINGYYDDEKDTFAGQLKELGNKTNELKEVIAAPLIPVFKSILDKISKGDLK